ncbi:MAG: polysaccharide deacetylase family protein [Clostridiales bacterium]|nr:polysaccharide deacetylase family protein [Clostridiales bacterium]
MAVRKKKKWVLIGLLVLMFGVAACVWNIWLQKEKEKAAVQETPEEADYSAAEEIEAALKKLEENPEKAQVITDINTIEKEIALCFEGTAESSVMRQIVDCLEEHGRQATFFLSAVDAGEDRDTADMILEAGHAMESYTLCGTSHMENLTQEELVEDFCRAQLVYEDKIGIVPTILKCNATDYTEELMEAAWACGYDSVLVPSHYLNYASFSDADVARSYVESVGKGSIITIKLGGYLDELEYEAARTDEDPAKDKQAGLELYEREEEDEFSENERLLLVVEWLLDALDEMEYETVPVSSFPSRDMGDLALAFEEIEGQYGEETAEVITAVHTTDRETAFTFRGLGDQEELTKLLAVLQEIEAGATFFVTGEEIDKYPEQIRQILEAGCEIGNGGYQEESMKEMSFGEICEDIYKTDLVLQGIGIESDLFMPPYGVVTEAVQKAAAALDKRLVLYNSSPARAEYVEQKYTADEVVGAYYSADRLVLCRGDITYFNMNVYQDTDSLAELVRAVYEQKVLPTDYGTREGHILEICTVSQLLDNTWNYPAATNATYQRIQASGRMKSSFEQMLGEYYIGNPYLALDGFSEGELAVIDQTGRVDTGGTNTVFLTFDDWGNEQTIGRILYVLRKHNIKATFFIKTQYVMDSGTENLLRAIAEEGHDIGSHTNTHMAIDITEDLISTLQQDLVTSNRVLSNVTGDTGALTDYFRPPTLAVNRTGAQTVFDCGYGYIINADVSTADYDVSSVEEMYDILLNGAILDSGERMKIQDGSVVVMHINTNSVYTAQGLDRYLNYVESLPDGDPGKFNFAKLSDYLH